MKDPSKKEPEQEDFEDDFDYGSFLGCDDDATQEEIDQAWEDQMC
jgi:hypothetical protein